MIFCDRDRPVSRRRVRRPFGSISGQRSGRTMALARRWHGFQHGPEQAAVLAHWRGSGGERACCPHGPGDGSLRYPSGPAAGGARVDLFAPLGGHSGTVRGRAGPVDGIGPSGPYRALSREQLGYDRFRVQLFRTRPRAGEEWSAATLATLADGPTPTVPSSPVHPGQQPKRAPMQRVRALDHRYKPEGSKNVEQTMVPVFVVSN